MEPSNLWVDVVYSIAEFKMRVLKELLWVLSPNRRIFVTAARFYNTTINTFDFVQKGHSFICVGRSLEGRSFDFITAEAKKIEAVLKAMLKLVFVKMAQAQT